MSGPAPRSTPAWCRCATCRAGTATRRSSRTRAAGREVAEWCQPMIRPTENGVVAFLVTQFGGVLHALVHALVQPGYKDVAELAPTVQCAPRNYDGRPRPPFVDVVEQAAPEQI